MNDAPIGVFDSGVGGLTVLKALGAELPGEKFIYLGDTARRPYGTKSSETVARYALQAAEVLASFGVKALVVACNTASAAGLPAIRERLSGMPVIGVIEPGADAACRLSKSGHIAVIGTEGTVRGGAYQDAIQRRRPDARVTAKAAQVFVALAEEGMHEGPIAEAVARHYLDSLFRVPAIQGVRGGALSRGAVSPAPDAGASGALGASDSGATSSLGVASGLARSAGSSAAVSSAGAGGASGIATLGPPDTLVLGCTHFPMLVNAIRTVAGSSVRIVDSAATTAKAVREQLAAAKLMGGAGRTTVRFLATDGTERFARVGTRFLGQTLSPDDVELIDL
ncbi:MAG: glutamate racemase [Gammaproteobacteria bacterium]